MPTALTVAIIAVAAITVITAVALINNRLLRTNRYNVRGVPQGLNGYKIINISDLHSRSYGKNQKRLLKKISLEKPDIIILSGDYVYGKRLKNALALAKALPSIAPTYYVCGNHEFKSKQHDVIVEGFNALGLKQLDNTFVIIQAKDEKLTLAGLSDIREYSVSSATDTYKGGLPTFKKALSKLDATTDGYKILVTHRPNFFEDYTKTGFNLVLTGHAHGGIVRLPGKRGLYASQQGFLPKYTEGFYSKDGTTMFVNRGCGGIPIRLFNLPEIAVITLIAK